MAFKQPEMISKARWDGQPTEISYHQICQFHLTASLIPISPRPLPHLPASLSGHLLKTHLRSGPSEDVSKPHLQPPAGAARHSVPSLTLKVPA